MGAGIPGRRTEIQLPPRVLAQAELAFHLIPEGILGVECALTSKHLGPGPAPILQIGITILTLMGQSSSV